MEFKILLTDAHRGDSLIAALCDLKTGRKVALLSVRTAWPLSGYPELRTELCSPCRSNRQKLRFLPKEVILLLRMALL